MQWYTPERHTCVELYDKYCDKLRDAGYSYVQATAAQALGEMTAEAVYLLDVIEHMYKEEAATAIELALKAATRQVVIFTPKGFMEQEEDGWQLGGDYWQKHRSGWLPGEFVGWKTQTYARGFFAVWTAK